MKTFLELIVIATTLFVFVACSQSFANEPVGDSQTSTTAMAKKTTTIQSDEVSSAGKSQTPKTTMSFASMVHDFGTIEEGEKVSHIFTFVNTGEEPLIINDVKSACGCTSKEWPKEPIAPGAESQIIVEFNSKGKAGNQTKTITINANTDPNPTRLTIKAAVNKASDS